MPVNRTIYTQGAVSIKAATAASWFSGNLSGAAGMFLSGVQSANFSANSPQQDVSSFGVLGTINKVQVESPSATLEVSVTMNSGNVTADPNWLYGLMTDAQQPTPSGVTVTASGVGQVTNAVLTSVRLEASVGGLATLSLTFDGNSGAPISAPTVPTTPNTQTVQVVTPDAFGTLYWGNGSVSGCPQTVRAQWEMPVERMNCLGAPIASPTIFSRPPGTFSLTVEGCDSGVLGNYLTGVKIGAYKIAQASGSMKETSRTANMAVGETAATYNVTSEGVGLGVTLG